MIGVLVSGEGTNLQALIDAGLPIVAVAPNTPGVRALERADAAGIETAVFEAGDYESREQRDVALAPVGVALEREHRRRDARGARPLERERAAHGRRDRP